MSLEAGRYKSIKASVTAEQTIKKSRFICLLAPVNSKEQALSQIAAVKKANYAARHNCSAYILGANGAERKYNDDGEPQGTAGVPMLEVLQKRGLTDILAVVTRYFGGVLLGAGGLARAYGGTVALAVDGARIVEYLPAQIYEITADYADYSKLEPLIRQLGGSVEADFGNEVKVSAKIPANNAEAFLNRLRDLFCGTLGAVLKGAAYIEVLENP